MTSRQHKSNNEKTSVYCWIRGYQFVLFFAVLDFLRFFVFHTYANGPTVAQIYLNKTCTSDADEMYRPQNDVYTGADDTSFPIATTTTAPEATTRSIVAYSPAKGDRFGSSILEMLGADAFSLQKKFTYRGACRTPKLENIHYRRFGKQVTLDRDIEKDSVLARLGIMHWEHYGLPCPTEDGNVVLLDPDDFRNNPFDVFTAEYLETLREKLVLVDSDHNLTQQREGTILHVAVHLRRGDVDVCSTGGLIYRYRYLPNAYYLTLLDDITNELERSGQKPYEITIYTEPEETGATESIEPFIERGYTIQTGGDEVEVWREMAQADVFVMSQSWFSGLPAILNKNGQVYFPPRPLQASQRHAMAPLPGWIQPTAKLVKLYHTELRRLQEQCPIAESRL